MGQQLLILIFSQIAAHGWWYCATQQNGILSTPLMLIPLMATGLITIRVVAWIRDHWDAGT